VIPKGEAHQTCHDGWGRQPSTSIGDAGMEFVEFDAGRGDEERPMDTTLPFVPIHLPCRDLSSNFLGMVDATIPTGTMENAPFVLPHQVNFRIWESKGVPADPEDAVLPPEETSRKASRRCGCSRCP
jgi:hypothetical protein